MIAADPIIHSSLNRHDSGLPREVKPFTPPAA
jgi:hypothetical protein